MNTEILEIKDLILKRGSKKVLGPLNARFVKGQFIGVLGPNGSGKTTLLQALNSFLPPSAGEIVLKGSPISKFTPKKRAQAISYITQDQNPDLSTEVSHILEMGRFPHHGEFEEIDQNDNIIIDRYSKYCSIDHLLNRPFSSLSGGERQRVLFAKALIQEAEILVMDEPSSNLDVQYEHALFSMSRELAREGKLIITAIHSLNLALEYCTHVMILHEESIAFFDRVSSIKNAELISNIFQVPFMMENNEYSGAKMLLHSPHYETHKKKSIHIIGGAGSAINLTRHCVEEGFNLSGGVAHSLDSDAELWQNLGISYVKVDAFAPIDDQSFQEAKDFLEKADLVILCDFPFGPGNKRNLELCFAARKLLILEDGGGGCTREFWVDGLSDSFKELCTSPHVKLVKYAEALEIVSQL